MTSTDIIKDTQIRPIRQGAVAAYLGEWEKWMDNRVKYI